MAKISAGSYDLNKWLHGGYESDIITTIYGPAGSGKTNFCMLAAVSQASKGNKVIYIDTEGGFSSERVKQMLNVKNGNPEHEKVMENILILKPTNFSEQEDAFDELLKHIKKQVSLIIVDGMTMLYRLEFANARESAKEKDNSEIQKINSSLAEQMRLLAEIARKQHIAVVVTNQIYNWDNESRMVGGDIMKYWSKCLIELIRENENIGAKRTAIIRKHRSLPESSLAFQVFDGGIRKKGWI